MTMIHATVVVNKTLGVRTLSQCVCTHNFRKELCSIGAHSPFYVLNFTTMASWTPTHAHEHASNPSHLFVIVSTCAPNWRHTIAHMLSGSYHNQTWQDITPSLARAALKVSLTHTNNVWMMIQCCIMASKG